MSFAHHHGLLSTLERVHLHLKFALLCFLLIDRLGAGAVLQFFLHGLDPSLQLDNLRHGLLVLSMPIDHVPADRLGDQREADGCAHGHQRDAQVGHGSERHSCALLAN